MDAEPDFFLKVSDFWSGSGAVEYKDGAVPLTTNIWGRYQVGVLIKSS